MLSDTCPVCGLPNELCVCSSVDKETSNVEIKVERRKYGKFWAIISGLDSDTADMKANLKTIKNKMACAGTIKGTTIEVLYGRNPRDKELIDCLVELGYNRDSISITKNSDNKK